MHRTILVSLLAAVLLAADQLAPGSAASDFTLSDTTGTSVSLASFRGKTVVLEWVNFDCPFVKKHYGSGAMPRLQAEWKGKGVVWLMICSSAPGKQGHFAGEALTARIAAEKAAPTHYLIDASGTVGKAYGAASTPQMVVIDGGGVVRYHGAIDSIRSADQADIPKAVNHVAQALTELTAGQEVTIKQTRAYGCSVKY